MTDDGSRETLLALYTGLEAIASHATELGESALETNAARHHVETIRMLARYTLDLARVLTSASGELQPRDTSLDGDETILLVDDQPGVRQVIAEVLRSRGYDVIEATDGENALLEVARHAAPVDLVVTDVMMPAMTGDELFRMLRRWYPSLRVLFMSGYDAGALTARMLEGDRTDFIPKPFVVDDLIRAMRRLLERA
ncbi:MAG: histidine kinase [Gemmatimonadetes bacterium]|nr:histidine kinase [Gemmatimonadota bacterium]